MDKKPSSNIYFFTSVLFFAMAWWCAPIKEGGLGVWYLLTVCFAFTGLVMGVDGMRYSVEQSSPFKNREGRILWALRPRAWMVAWGVIVVIAMTYGTPHLLYQYPKHGPYGQCEYIGLNGLKSAHTTYGGSMNGCAIVRLLL